MVGVRVREKGLLFYTQTRAGLQDQIVVSPDDFLVRTGNVTKPYEIYGTDIYVHVPRSLCNRARVVVNIMTDKIVSNQPAPACLNK